MCDNLSYENIFNIYVNHYDIIIRVLTFLNIIDNNVSAADLMCEMEQLKILDPLKSQCTASASSLLYLLTNNGNSKEQNIINPDNILPLFTLANNQKLPDFNNFFRGINHKDELIHINPTKPYLYFLNLNNNYDEGNFSGHVSNLIYIPNSKIAREDDLSTIQSGKFYCIQSFIYLYTTQLKELSYYEFINYIRIYLHRFNTSSSKNFDNLTFNKINFAEYLAVIWATNIDDKSIRLHGIVPDVTIKIYEINDIEVILSRLIKILSYQHIYFKILLKYLTIYYRLFDNSIKVYSKSDDILTNPFCNEGKKYILYNIDEYNKNLLGNKTPLINNLLISYNIDIDNTLVSNKDGFLLEKIIYYSKITNIKGDEYFEKHIINGRKFSEDTIDCLNEIIKIYDSNIKLYILHFNNLKIRFESIISKNIIKIIKEMQTSNYIDFLIIIALIDLFKFRYYEKFIFTTKLSELEENNETYFLINDFIDDFIKKQTKTICTSPSDNYKVDDWSYQIIVIAYIILKLFYPKIFNIDNVFNEIEFEISKPIISVLDFDKDRFRIFSEQEIVLKNIQKLPNYPIGGSYLLKYKFVTYPFLKYKFN